MESTLKAVRAIAAELFFRFYKPILITVLIVFVVLFALCIWLVTLSAWWWLLFAVVVLWFVIAVLFLTISYAVVNAVRPTQTKAQRQQLKLFVDKIERVKEVAEVPKFFIIFRIVRDAVRPSEHGYITGLTDDAKSLKNDFIEYRDSFKRS